MLAARESNGEFDVLLVGDEERIYRHLDRAEAESLGISVQHSAERISMEESAAFASRRKQDSSIVVATRLLKEGEIDALVSAGNTGAVVTLDAPLRRAGSLGCQRPAIAVLSRRRRDTRSCSTSAPTPTARPIHLYQFALMGKVYAQYIFDVAEPRIGLLNIGEEHSKGSRSLGSSVQAPAATRGPTSTSSATSRGGMS